MRARAVAV